MNDSTADLLRRAVQGLLHRGNFHLPGRVVVERPLWAREMRVKQVLLDLGHIRRLILVADRHLGWRVAEAKERISLVSRSA